MRALKQACKQKAGRPTRPLRSTRVLRGNDAGIDQPLTSS
ncbi:hypothetical protein WQQ_25280 [Hydrocarboniphaga effusa AP103]|uniref:Uncharacterized protein n=1 Tax=Hydrocarboniphaga effusa AP103 TaxID=1172194 RepID=I8HZE9_9GAMM|nr:hypothetical protein WQQ_25280 [Hydrocarboniphaga effusa AP103]